MAIVHAVKFIFWLKFQLLLATWTVVIDTLTGNKKIDPCVVTYPLRVTNDWQITLFATSITITPGTMSLTIVDDDEDQEQGDRHLIVHAVYGSNPDQVLADLAQMEEMLAPHVAGITHDLSAAKVEYPAPKATSPGRKA